MRPRESEAASLVTAQVLTITAGQETTVNFTLGDAVPPALLHHLKHNKVLHERIVLLSIVLVLNVAAHLLKERAQRGHA